MTETDPTFREDLMNRLFRIPTRVTAIVLVAAIGVGLLLGGIVGWVLLGFAVLVLAGMLALLWPDIPNTERMLRLAVLLLVVALAAIRLT
ncbi:MAG: hypothetical protein Q4G43_14875 [Mobilicoccus sp.]|nr:hypothetical protein [Mobilicoccus sp.]